MAYLFQGDYKQLIQTDNLNQIIGNDSTVLDRAELVAISEIKSYLVQKYNVDQEFTDTVAFTLTDAYTANYRVYLDASAYNAATNYGDSALVLQAGNVYKKGSGYTGPAAFNAAHWVSLGKQYTIFHAVAPEAEWDYYTEYADDADVYYNGKTYTATRITTGQRPDLYPEVWGNGTAYTITAASDLTDDDIWEQSDNRNPQMVASAIDVVLYHLHSRIAPRNIPELRVKRYDDAISWLKQCAKGEHLTADLPKIQPRQGARVRWANILNKQNNNF